MKNFEGLILVIYFSIVKKQNLFIYLIFSCFQIQLAFIVFLYPDQNPEDSVADKGRLINGLAGGH